MKDAVDSGIRILQMLRLLENKVRIQFAINLMKLQFKIFKFKSLVFYCV